MNGTYEELFMCARCRGLLVVERLLTNDEPLVMARCTGCGDMFDELVLLNRGVINGTLVLADI